MQTTRESLWKPAPYCLVSHGPPFEKQCNRSSLKRLGQKFWCTIEWRFKFWDMRMLWGKQPWPGYKELNEVTSGVSAKKEEGWWWHNSFHTKVLILLKCSFKLLAIRIFMRFKNWFLKAVTIFLWLNIWVQTVLQRQGNNFAELCNVWEYVLCI